MSEARVLASFWQPKAKRFVSLTGSEVLERSGIGMTSSNGRSLVARGFIRMERLDGVKTDNRAYTLTPAGERRVSAMVVMGTLPKPVFRLTANPMKGAVR